MEVEAKFHVADLPALRHRLIAAGGIIARERVYEKNIRLEIDGNRLLVQGQLLRLRQDGRNVLTFKGMPPAGTRSEVKVREELEITVSDFDTALAIFQRLGYEPAQIYEKYRETFHFESLELVLDELPYGDFVELEGEEVAIKAAAARLELDWSRRLNTNYLALMGQLIELHNLPFSDLTFRNFQTTSATISDILPE